MLQISSNIADARIRFTKLESANFGTEEGYYLVLVKIKDGNTAGGTDQFEVMGRKFGEGVSKKAKRFNAYRILGEIFDSNPVEIDLADEGEWHLVTKK